MYEYYINYYFIFFRTDQIVILEFPGSKDKNCFKLFFLVIVIALKTERKLDICIK